MVEENMLKM